MSVDLYVWREGSSWTAADVDAAVASLPEGIELDGNPDYPGCGSVAFWHIDRCSVELAEAENPEDFDADDDETWVKIVTAPHIVVSSGSQLWPWVHCTAALLAERLAASIYDPQEGTALDEQPPPLQSLRAAHDQLIAQEKPVLEVCYRSSKAGNWSSERDGNRQLRVVLAAVDKVVRALGGQVDVSAGDRQVNWFAAATLASGLSVRLDSIHNFDGSRSVAASGPADRRSELDQLVSGLSQQLDATFRSVLKYRL